MHNFICSAPLPSLYILLPWHEIVPSYRGLPVLLLAGAGGGRRLRPASGRDGHQRARRGRAGGGRGDVAPGPDHAGRTELPVGRIRDDGRHLTGEEVLDSLQRGGMKESCTI